MQKISSKSVAPASADKAAEKSMTGNPLLDNPASWVIREKATGDVLFETFDKAKVDALNTVKYEAVPIHEHLASLNRKAASAPGL